MPTGKVDGKARDAATDDPLQRYRSKRDFAVTAEPPAERAASGDALAFVVQKHDATRLHYDFRLELDGVMLSWAVPKGPSFDPADKRMALRTEDHPVAYNRFEGTIPKGQYGAGTVIVWDRGTWTPVGDPRAGLKAGKLAFDLHGSKLAGRWELVRIRKPGEERQDPWLLFKKRDAWARPKAEFDVVRERPDSIVAKPLPLLDGATPAAGDAGPKAKRARAARPPPRAALPATLSPQLATLAEAPPTEGDWLYEVKFDGYRLLARLERGRARLITRGGHDWSDRMPQIVAALQALPLQSGWLDGEIVVHGEHGVPDFNRLQRAFDGRRTEAIVYCLFDLPFADGLDLRAQPLTVRREALKAVLAGTEPDGPLRFSEAFVADARTIVAAACKLHLEGVIAKRADAPYVGRRSVTWLKLKCQQRQEFVIGGYTDRGADARAGEIGSLLLGLHDAKGRLRFVGSVGTGWDMAAARALKTRLLPLTQDRAPFDGDAAVQRGRWTRRAAGSERWVRPELVAEVAFAEWTPDGQLRHARFHALREDKPARAVTVEPRLKAAPRTAAKPALAATSTTAATARVARLRISHPERVIDASTGTTKLDLVRYYESVAEWMLPHLKGRACSLVRGPTGVEGELFFQKHADKLRIPGVRSLDTALWPEHEPLLEVPSATALVAAAQMNVIEFHTWNSRVTRFDRPDRVVFDIDPGEGVPWQQVQEAAALVRALLEELSLRCWLKTSGGKGLHVVVPLAPRRGWDEVKDFSQAVVQHLARVIPDRFVAKSGPANRVGRIFVDWLRNTHGATTAAAFSARARPGLGVSMPVAWAQLDELKSGAHWTVATARDHLSLRPADPWADYAACRQTLGAALKALGTTAAAPPAPRRRSARAGR